jgi:hypothetical protein
VPNILTDFKKFEFSQQIFIEDPYLKLHVNKSSNTRAPEFGDGRKNRQMEGRT